MSKLTTGVIAGLVIAAVGGPAIVQYRSQVRLRRENDSLRQQASQAARLSADNQDLSNRLAQFRVAQASVNEQFEELIRLRAELNRLKQNQQSNSLAQVRARDQAQELAILRDEVRRLQQENLELQGMREELLELRAAALAAAATITSTAASSEETAAPRPSESEEQPLALRVIRTQGPLFAENLKRSVAAHDTETFQEVFSRFLQSNGVQTNRVAAAVYDERTGSVIVRATQATLNQVEQLISALERAP